MTTPDPSRLLGTVQDRFHRVLIGYTFVKRHDDSVLQNILYVRLSKWWGECVWDVEGGDGYGHEDGDLPPDVVPVFMLVRPPSQHQLAGVA